MVNHIHLLEKQSLAWLLRSHSLLTLSSLSQFSLLVLMLQPTPLTLGILSILPLVLFFLFILATHPFDQLILSHGYKSVIHISN